MKVSDVVIKAFTLLGRTELATKISNNQQLTDEEREARDTMLFCFNAVEDEVARSYVRLTNKQDLSGSNGEYYFTGFLRSPLSIISVTRNGKPADYTLYHNYLYCEGNGKLTVEYTYAPQKKEIGGNSDFSVKVGENLLAYGAASEYCLINGEVQAAELWESKYRQAIDAAQTEVAPIGQLHAGGYIPPRRWV